MPCGACREFLMQLSYKNRNIEIMVDYAAEETITLDELIPKWWELNDTKVVIYNKNQILIPVKAEIRTKM